MKLTLRLETDDGHVLDYNTDTSDVHFSDTRDFATIHNPGKTSVEHALLPTGCLSVAVRWTAPNAPRWTYPGKDDGEALGSGGA